MTKKQGIYAGLLVLLLILAGCATEPQPIEGAWMNCSLQEDEAGSRLPLTVMVERAGDSVGVDFRGIVFSGTVRAELTSATTGIIWQEEITSAGPFVVNTVVNPPAAGEYQLRLVWDGPLQIQYALQWKPGQIEIPTISPLALMSGIGMTLAAVGFVVYLIVIHQMDWKYLGLGAPAWIITVLLKLFWATAANPDVYSGLTNALPEAAAMPIFCLYVGSLTGVFEVAAGIKRVARVVVEDGQGRDEGLGSGRHAAVEIRPFGPVPFGNAVHGVAAGLDEGAGGVERFARAVVENG